MGSTLPRIIGSPGGLSTVTQQVDLVAKVSVPVLLIGETGSGKEVIAKAIHFRSHRSQRPFVRVNCGSISSELIDAELFGHEKGSFTGAIDTRSGWFEKANGGTLLLDEIGEMGQEAQVRLLRVLQEGEFYRVGGKNLIKVDVRIIAATHRDLNQLVAENRFRHDLLYRISTFPIKIPPLRERLSDIIELTHFFVERSAHKFGIGQPQVTPKDIELLTSYDWPGNIRELITVIERAVLLGQGRVLQTEPALGMFRPNTSHSMRVSKTETDRGLPPLQEVIVDHIKEALKLTNGRVDGPFGAARVLDLNPNTLRSKMRKYGIS